MVSPLSAGSKGDSTATLWQLDLQVMKIIMANEDKASMIANHCMIDTKGGNTNTINDLGHHVTTTQSSEHHKIPAYSDRNPTPQ